MLAAHHLGGMMSLVAATELCLLLRELGIAAQPVRRPVGVRLDNGTCLEVAEAEVSTSTLVAQLQAATPASAVLVTSELRAPHRAALEEAGVGWLDRRGHLRVPSLEIDQLVADLTAPVPPLPDVWRRASVVAVALVLMQRDGPVPPIHDLGFYAGITRNAAVQALEALHSVGMIDDHDVPRRDALLMHLSARWWTRWFGLAARPDVAELDGEERIVLGVDEDLRRPGWACLDEEQSPTAAVGPPRLLVPDRRALVWMRRRWGTAEDHVAAAALVAAAPNPVAAAARRPSSAGYPLAHQVTIELERHAPGITVVRGALD
jgi:hypothetical protein